MLISYAIRSLKAQRGAVLPTVIAMFVAIAMVSSMTLVIANVERVLMESGRPDNAIVMEKDTTRFAASAIPFAELARLELLPGIVKEGNGVFGGVERVSFVRLHYVDTMLPGAVVLRGVDPVALRLHEKVRITSGSLPPSGTPGVLVGEKRIGEFAEMKNGGTIQIGRSHWPIVGTFSAPGTFYESELWCDRTALLAELAQPPIVSALVARIDGPDAIASMNRELSTRRDNDVFALSELDYNRELAKGLLPYIATAWALTAVMMIAAAFATLSTMHALLLRRLREIATLMAIGFTRRAMIAMLVLESFTLAAVGAVGGYLVSFSLLGRTIDVSDWDIVVRLAPSAKPALYSAVVLGAVVSAGVTISVVQIRRLGILDALRAA